MAGSPRFGFVVVLAQEDGNGSAGRERGARLLQLVVLTGGALGRLHHCLAVPVAVGAHAS